MTSVLVAGGAGYIGSVVAKHFVQAGYEVVVFDNFSRGEMRLVDPGATMFSVDLCDKEKLSRLMHDLQFDIVVNCAGYKAVGESMKDPIKYSDNIMGMINLLNACVENKVKKVIFSSSAGVYGSPVEEVIDENTDCRPTSFYGYTKLASEELLAWYKKCYDLDYVALRYFNVAGDAGLNYIDPDAQNIFPIICEVIYAQRDKLTIFGNDFITRDGTCLRDYVDVSDLARAHVLATGVEGSEIINLGSGKGSTVTEVVKAFKDISGRDFPVEFGPRRDGDPGVLLANIEKAEKVLKWTPSNTLQDMVRTTLSAYKINHSKTF